MAESPARRSFFNRFLDVVERGGNKLPDPVTLFLILIGVVMLVSLLASAGGLAAIHPGTGESIDAVSLFSSDNIQRWFVEMPQTIASLPPLTMGLPGKRGHGASDQAGCIGAELGAVWGDGPTA